MNLSDTIVACATPPGRSARALVRVSGPDLGPLLRETVGSSPPPGASVARFHLFTNRALPVLLLRACAPRSYTGEDTAELLIPGNPDLVQRVLARFISTAAADVRLAEPGEFTARAYLHGKLSVAQAEGVAATIAARTEEELGAARALLGGSAGERYRAWADETATLLALVECGVDFSDQEGVVAIPTPLLSARLGALSDAISSFIGARRGTEARSHAPVVVLVGVPNAGKSTLFNAILGRARAVASPHAGTTRDALRETLDLARDLPGAGVIELVDLAGLDEPGEMPDQGAGPREVEREAQRSARETIANADAAIYCDPSGRFEPRTLLGHMRTIIRVRTKADLPKPATTSGARPEPVPCVPVCAIDGWNLSTLRRTLADTTGNARSEGLAALLPRHSRALSAALGSLTQARSLLDHQPHDPALIADSLRAALDALGELVGRMTPDDVLGRIFSTFCIGK